MDEKLINMNKFYFSDKGLWTFKHIIVTIIKKIIEAFTEFY